MFCMGKMLSPSVLMSRISDFFLTRGTRIHTNRHESRPLKAAA